MDKKIGILTFWGVPNYGAFAQAYALNAVLRTIQTNYQVTHIGYLHPEHYKLYFQKKPPRCSRFRTLLNPRYYGSWIQYLKNRDLKYPTFINDWEKIPHETIKFSTELETKKWDIIFTGSDAIWEYSIKELGNDPHLIGNHLNCRRLYAYAASFGKMNINSTFPKFVKSGLKNYQQISVRDQNSYEIVKQLIGTDPEIVIDPSLLWDFKSDSNIPVPAYENYILVYGLEFSESMITEIKVYAKKNHLTIIGAGLAPAWCDERLTDIGPLEWIGMFSKAEFIVTCTFHGLMFSINFNKKVLFNQVSYVANRSATLLSELGLLGLFENKVTLKNVLEYPWDYDSINCILDILRKKSKNFLQEAVGHE